MKPQEYWARRSEQIARRQHLKADRYVADLGREYGRAIQSIQRDIEAFYGRFAINNEIDLADARKLLTAGELKEFKMSLEEFTAKAKNNADGRWTQQLNNVYYRTRVSRLEALQLQIRQQVEMLAASEQTGMRELLGDVYEDTYYRTLFEIQKGTGIGTTFAKIDREGVDKVLGTEFAGSNWSKRIWADRDKLATELHTKLTQSFIRGDSVDRTVRDVVDRFNVSRSNAKRLVQTESAFFTEQATMDSYKESGVVGEYEILATLDNRTSPICQEMDGKVFRLSEAEVGVTYPPFHPNCRTTTVPYFDDEEDVGERIARDADGQTYYVPGDMTYEQWKRDYVDSTTGLASGRGKRDNDSERLRFVQKIEPSDIPEAVKSYEDVIRHADVEHAYVIQSDGSVFTKGGSEAWIGFSEDEIKQLKGAVVTHNHPTPVTQWSFSEDDLRLYVDGGMKELRATDEKFVYSLTGKTNIDVSELKGLYTEAEYEALDRIIDSEYDFDEIDFYHQHEIISIVAEKIGLIYRRWQVD